MSQNQRNGGGQQFAVDYIDVAARLVEFREKHPGGSLQPADLNQPYKIEVIGDQTFIVVIAAAYRTTDDPRPGVGMAYEVFPGRTPYTRGSELQNAETSAWGRAIVAALAADTKRGIASAEEVRNRRAEQEGDEAMARHQARHQARSEIRKAPAAAPTDGPAPEAGAEAKAVAELAAVCNDAEKLRNTFKEAGARNLLNVDVSKVVHADLLDQVGIDPGTPGGVRLREWLAAAGSFVAGHGGISVREAATQAAGEEGAA